MEILIFLVPLAAVVVVAAVFVFFWALRRGQFDDLESPGWRIVFDDQHQRRQSADDTAAAARQAQTAAPGDPHSTARKDPQHAPD